MDLFAESGNFDIEGIDSKNACYGGTAALFNAINWVESSSWDGRNAIVVAGDIAVYAEGAARPAGGAGACAILIGPNAPVVFEREFRCSTNRFSLLTFSCYVAIHGNYMANTYDFYKPNLSSEYPEVDGPVSVVTYVAALDAAYNIFKDKVGRATKRAVVNGHASSSEPAFSLEDVDYAIFHSPYGKQAVKGHARLLYNDFLSNPEAPRFAGIPDPESLLSATHAASLTDKNVEKTFIAASKASFKQKSDPGMACSRRLGNMYTASLYGCLASLLATVEPAQLKDKRVSLFSFGSGCASSFFTLRVKGDTSEIKGKMQLIERLSTMSVVPPEEFVAALAVREQLLSVLGAKLIILLAPGEEPQCGQLHTRGSRGEHLAWSLLPGQRRCQIPTKICQGSSHRLNIKFSLLYPTVYPIIFDLPACLNPYHYYLLVIITRQNGLYLYALTIVPSIASPYQVFTRTAIMKLPSAEKRRTRISTGVLPVENVVSIASTHPFTQQVFEILETSFISSSALTSTPLSSISFFHPTPR